MKDLIAHYDKKEDRTHLLSDHLEKVGLKAETFLNGDPIAYWAGKWHDLGKSRQEWQSYIKDKNNLDDGFYDGEDKLDHSTSGALFAANYFGRSTSVSQVLTAVIAGHHGGLPDQQPLLARLEKKSARFSVPCEDVPADAVTVPKAVKNRLDLEFYTRLVFSALTDADYLDTAAFYRPHQQLKPQATLVSLLSKVRKALLSISQKAPDTEMNRIREAVKVEAMSHAREPQGVFALNAPTGTGKTLLALLWALEHAVHHKLERIIFAVPRTAIIEQTAKVYRDILGDENVVEHHSDLEFQRDWLVCENWDAPLILTTDVQLFESMFKNRSSKLRRLHRMQNSVIVLDEVHMLPIRLIDTICSGIDSLVTLGGSTFVLSTATQPPFDMLVSKPRPLLDNPPRIERVVLVPKPETLSTYDELARNAYAESRVLVIVHKRKEVEKVASQMGTDTFVLSGYQCSAHRKKVLHAVRDALREDSRPVRVVSTQLIEAGVDLDFPVVYRAEAGLDSLAQAAGRCNREGRMRKLGELRLFELQDEKGRVSLPPPAKQLRAGQQIYREQQGDINNPRDFTKFFRTLYRRLKQHRSDLQIQEDRKHYKFKTVATKFQMVEESAMTSVVVPFDDKAKKLIANPDVKIRSLQPYIVQIFTFQLEQLQSRGLTDSAPDAKFIVLKPEAYDQKYGVKV